MKSKSLLISAIAGALTIIVVFTTILIIKKTSDINQTTSPSETTTLHAQVSGGKLIVNGVEVDPESVGVDEEDLDEYADKVNKGEEKLPDTVIKYIYQNSPTTTKKSNSNNNNPQNTDGETTKFIKVTGVTLTQTKTTRAVNSNSFKIIAVCTPLNATNKSLTWKSSNPDVASINHLGSITCHKIGKTTITVTTNDGGKTAKCELTVVEKITTTIPSKPSTTIVRPDEINDTNVIANIREYVTVYNVAANNTKLSNDKVTIKKTINSSITNFSCSNSIVEGYLRTFFEKYLGNFTDTKTFQDGKSGQITLKNYLPVAGKISMSSLPNTTDAVKSIAVSNGYPTRIGLQYESATESKPASNHGSCMNIIDPSAFSTLNFKFASIQIKFYESSITPKFVTVNGEDRLASVTLKTNFQTVGDAVISSPYGSSVSAQFSGYAVETYDFDWQ